MSRTITRKELESIQGTCPRCGSILSLDHSGCPKCRKCRDELSLDEYVEVDLDDVEIWIIDPKKYNSPEKKTTQECADLRRDE